MIRYSLVCACGHEFEGWFGGSAAYDAQAAKGQVTCPACGSTRVEKAIMAPNVARSARAGRPEPTEGPSKETSKAGTLVQTPEMKQVRELARRLREHVVQSADYVGDRFAKEARKIHHEEAEPRGIYGEATADEARALSEEGIDFHSLPSLPEDRN